MLFADVLRPDMLQPRFSRLTGQIIRLLSHRNSRCILWIVCSPLWFGACNRSDGQAGANSLQVARKKKSCCFRTVSPCVNKCAKSRRNIVKPERGVTHGEKRKHESCDVLIRASSRAVKTKKRLQKKRLGDNFLVLRKRKGETVFCAAAIAAPFLSIHTCMSPLPHR